MRSILLKSLSALSVVVSMHTAATPVLFSGSSGGLSATVSFDIVGSQLQVVLSNTSIGDVLVPSDVLTAVFFNIAGNPLLTRNSAIREGRRTSVPPTSAEPGRWSVASGRTSRA